MDAGEFTARLKGLTGRDIKEVAQTLRREFDTADGELSWWRATLTITGQLRREKRTREAGLAAHQASTAVLGAAARDGVLEHDRDAVTLVARAASEAARALVAGCATPPVFVPWSLVFSVAA